MTRQRALRNQPHAQDIEKLPKKKKKGASHPRNHCKEFSRRKKDLASDRLERQLWTTL